MLNIKSSDIEITNKMCNAYSLFIDSYSEKNGNESINYLKEQIKYLDENMIKYKDKEEQYSLLNLKSKIKILELSANEEKKNNNEKKENYISLINEIFNSSNNSKLNKLSKEE